MGEAEGGLGSSELSVAILAQATLAESPIYGSLDQDRSKTRPRSLLALYRPHGSVINWANRGRSKSRIAKKVHGIVETAGFASSRTVAGVTFEVGACAPSWAEYNI